MKRKLCLTLLSCILALSVSACGGSGASAAASSTADSSTAASSTADSSAAATTENAPEAIGPFSGVGGWLHETGILFLMNSDGTALMMTGMYFPKEDKFTYMAKQPMTWKEDENTVTADSNGEIYSFKKQKDGETENLILGEETFTRVSDTDYKKYYELSETIAAPEPGSGASSESSGEPGKIEFTDTILLDNDIVTVELTEFYEEEVNWAGSDGPQMEKYITLKVTNKSKKEILFNLQDPYIDDESARVIMQDGNDGPAPGKKKSFSYNIQYNSGSKGKPLDSLDDLYTLDAEIDISVYDDAHTYLTQGPRERFCINDVIKGAGEAAAAAENRKSYPDVFAAISKTTWLFNGGDDTILNYVEFKENKAAVGQVYFDGNGLHDNGTNDYAYEISDKDITVTTSGSELVIPYKLNGKDITLGSGDYFSLEQVEKGLQGYWKYSYNSSGKKEGYLYVDHGNLSSESASSVSGGAAGEYYYYGPYTGKYKLGIGCFETDLFKGSNWFYNIIDGKPVILYYEHVCVPAKGFAGENGYSF